MRILIAEDNTFYRHMLQATLREWGYEVIAASDGNEAWRVLQQPDAPKLAILDWVMPGLDGPEVCRRLRAMHKPEPTYVIVLTSKDGKDNIIAALESGADDYVTKPFDREELRVRLKVGLRIVGLQTSEAVVYAFARAVDAKSPYTQGHAERVTAYALALAGQIGLPETEKELLRKGAILHDIGKISIPDSILNKPGPLTTPEFEIIKQHTIEGVRIVEPLQSIREVIPLIRWHHERLDGGGYPDGLPAKDIPLLVRILSVADVYDALSSVRPYRSAMPHDVCMEQLRSNAATGGLDSDLVESFGRVMRSSVLAPPSREMNLSDAESLAALA